MSEIPRIEEVENLARMARLNMAKDGYLSQIAFLWSGQNVAIIRSRPFKDARDKAAWAAILRRACVQLSADTVLYIMEIFAAPPPPSGAMDDMMGPVQGRTGAYEAVLFHLESMDGTWSCIVPIIRSPGQPPSFPMPRFWTKGRVDGLLANFIPDKRSGAYEEGK